MQLLLRNSAFSLSLSLALISIILPTPVSSARSCPPLGAILPAPQSPSSSTHLAPSIANLTSLLDATLAAHYNDSAVAIAVQSIHEDAPLFTYYRTPKTHAGPSYGGGGKGGGGGGSERDVDGETIFRVGSVSKLVAALAALQLSHSHGQEKARIDLDASVLKYIPQLANSTAEGIVRTPWEDVTVRSLTSHLSGLSTNSTFLLPLPLPSPIPVLITNALRNYLTLTMSTPSCHRHIPPAHPLDSTRLAPDRQRHRASMLRLSRHDTALHQGRPHSGPEPPAARVQALRRDACILQHGVCTLGPGHRSCYGARIQGRRAGANL